MINGYWRLTELPDHFVHARGVQGLECIYALWLKAVSVLVWKCCLFLFIALCWIYTTNLYGS